MHEYGDPAVLVLDDVPDPEPRAGWVTVRLEASALNWHDVLVRRGQYASPLSHVPGADGAGVRLDTGEPVVVLPSLFWGTREAATARDFEILGDHVPGTYAELVSVPAECVVPRPPGLGLAEAAAFSLVGVTTYRALFSRGRLTAGESLLVLGASGGVATAAVALGSAAGLTWWSRRRRPTRSPRPGVSAPSTESTTRTPAGWTGRGAPHPATRGSTWYSTASAAGRSPCAVCDQAVGWWSLARLWPRRRRSTSGPTTSASSS
jgi:hypothetical protein